MKYKKTITFIIVLIIIIVIGPYIVGTIARNKLERMANLVSQMPGYSLKINSYDQGWFSSHAVIAFGFDQNTVNNLENSAKKGIELNFLNRLKKKMLFDITITHGPVNFHNGINFNLLTLSKNIQPPENNSLKHQSKTPNLINLFATVSYGGTTRIAINSPTFKIAYSNFTGMDINITLNSALDHYTAQAKINKLAVNIAKETIILNQMNLTSSGTRTNAYLWLGKGTFSLDKLMISSPDKPLFLLTKATSNYALNRENNTALTMHWQSRLAAVRAAGFNLKNFRMNLDINHLDMAAMTDYVKSVQDIYQTPDGKSLTPQQTAAKIQVISARVGKKILENSPKIVINNLDFSLGDGSLKSDAMLSFNGQKLTDLKQLSHSSELNKRLNVRANLIFDAKMATAIMAIGFKRQMAAAGMDINRMTKAQFDQAVNIRTTGFLKGFLAKKFLKRDGNSYSTHFEMKNGQRLINGKALPIPGR